MQELINTFVAIGMLCLVFMIAFLPTFIASKRDHRNTMAIFICNAVGFFTYGIFWVIALIWAFVDSKREG